MAPIIQTLQTDLWLRWQVTWVWTWILRLSLFVLDHLSESVLLVTEYVINGSLLIIFVSELWTQWNKIIKFTREAKVTIGLKRSNLVSVTLKTAILEF